MRRWRSEKRRRRSCTRHSDKLEALIQHNEAKLSTWLPLEYDLQMTYGSKECSFCTYMEHLRETVREDSRGKIRKESEQQ